MSEDLLADTALTREHLETLVEMDGELRPYAERLLEESDSATRRGNQEAPA